MIPNWHTTLKSSALENAIWKAFQHPNTGNVGHMQCCCILPLCSICKIRRRQACCCFLHIDTQRPSASQVVEAFQPKLRTAVVPSDSVLTHCNPGGPDRLQTPRCLFLDPLGQRGGVLQLTHEAQARIFSVRVFGTLIYCQTRWPPF